MPWECNTYRKFLLLRQVEEPNAFAADLVVQILLDASILDIKKPYIQQSIPQLLEELCSPLRVSRLG